MWLFEQIKKHPYLALATLSLLGVATRFILPFITTASTFSIVVTTSICIVGSISLGGCLGWLVNLNRPVLVPESPSAPQEEEKHDLSQPVPNIFENEGKLDGVSTSLIHKAFSSEEDYTNILANYLDNIAHTALVQASRSLYQSFHPSLQDKLGCKLLQHGVYGEEKEVEALLQGKSPQRLQSLLFTFETTVTHYSGQQIKGNFIRILLSAEDTDMIRMIWPFLIRACDSEEAAQTELKRQYDAQFSEESKIAEAKTVAADSEALRQVIQAIRDASDADCKFLLNNVEDSQATEEKPVGSARAQFRAYWNKKTESVITTGKHSNAELLAEAFNQYDTNYDTFGGWNMPKNNLVWRQVIGYIQRYVSTCIAQALCQGIYYIVNNGEPLSRALKFRFSPSFSYFPLSSGGLRLGFDYADGEVRAEGHGWYELARKRECFLQLMSRKNSEMASLCNASANPGQRPVVAP